MASSTAGRMPFSMNDGPVQRYSLEVVGTEVLRPRTAQSGRASRPGTSRAMSRGNTAGGQYNIVVLTENRSRQIGLAVCNLAATHTIELIQLADNQSFSQTLALLQVMRPVEIVIPKSQSERVLFQKIIAQWGSDSSSTNTQVSAINRKFFDEVLGESLAKSLTATTVNFDMASRYLALCSLAALVKYVEHVQHLSFVKGSINFVWKEQCGRMSLDFETVRNLELLTNSRTGTAKESLFGMINNTKTGVGAQFLRAQLLSPVNDGATLNTRLDCVEELLSREVTYYALITALSKLPDLDTLLSALTAAPRVATPKTARQAIAALIALKHVIASMPGIADSLETSTGSLLVAIRGNLTVPALEEIREVLDAVLTEDTAWSKSAVQQRQQECFAVRPNIDGNLDAVRKVYVECLNEIHELAEAYRVEWEQPALKLSHNATRGYHLVLPITTQELPIEVVQVVQNKSSIACSTEDMLSLNERVKENLFNIYVMTNVVIQETMERVRGGMQALFKVTESIALLDMLLSFARLSESATPVRPYVRPTYSANGPLSITKGRHPMLDRSGGGSTNGTCVPNDVYLGPVCNFRVLTGPNCSGKSTYLKMSALVVVLAHLGCFVPAEAACVRLTDRICSRLGTGDDIESNASTFLKEMKETAFILEASTNASFIIIDELGRGTSNEDGVGIAWAVCEHLLATRAHTLFVTHFHEIAELAVTCPNVRNTSMTVTTTSGDASLLHFSFEASEGSSPHCADYGIQLAEMCGLPAPVIAEAKAFKDHLLVRISTRATAATAGVGSSRSSAAAHGTPGGAGSAGAADASAVSRPTTALIALSAGAAAAPCAPSHGGISAPPPAPEAQDIATVRAAADIVAKLAPLLPYAAALASLQSFDPEHLDAVRRFLGSVRQEGLATLQATGLGAGAVAALQGAIQRRREELRAAEQASRTAQQLQQPQGPSRPGTTQFPRDGGRPGTASAGNSSGGSTRPRGQLPSIPQTLVVNAHADVELLDAPSAASDPSPAASLQRSPTALHSPYAYGVSAAPFAPGQQQQWPQRQRQQWPQVPDPHLGDPDNGTDDAAHLAHGAAADQSMAPADSSGHHSAAAAASSGPRGPALLTTAVKSSSRGSDSLPSPPAARTPATSNEGALGSPKERSPALPASQRPTGVAPKNGGDAGGWALGGKGSPEALLEPALLPRSPGGPSLLDHHRDPISSHALAGGKQTAVPPSQVQGAAAAGHGPSDRSSLATVPEDRLWSESMEGLF